MGETLQQTPTWAIATVCSVFVALSLVVERTIFYTGKWLKEHNHSPLYEALEKIKEELMLLGFVSLFLTMAQNDVAKICIPEKAAQTMLPCDTASSESITKHESSCTAEGTVPFVPLEGLHQLHILIFIMAISHVLYSFVTMTLGRWRVIRWRRWEEETKTEEYRSIHGTGYKHTRQSTFVKKHATSFWSRYTVSRYIEAFFLQFTGSVTKVDYLTLRHGFIMNHMNRNVQFDFHKYILRSLEDDFKFVVGISPILWMFLILFVLMNVYGWRTYLWISIVPLLMVLAVGAKLRHVITKLAFEITERHTMIQGMPIVKPRNELFWFGKPELVLFLIHFILFQNAFELSYYSWALATFGTDSCFHQARKILLLRFGIGLLVQIICSYITLPLYALVTQMGSHLKRSIFDDHVREALQRWKRRAKLRVGDKDQGSPGVEVEEDLYHHNVPQEGSGESLEDHDDSEKLQKYDANFEDAPPSSPTTDNGESSKRQSTLQQILSSFKKTDYIGLSVEMESSQRK